MEMTHGNNTETVIDNDHQSASELAGLAFLTQHRADGTLVVAGFLEKCRMNALVPSSKGRHQGGRFTPPPMSN